MIIYLTSSPTGDLDGGYVPEGIDNRNGFLDQLRKFWKENARCLMIPAAPGDLAGNEEMLDFFCRALRISGLTLERMDLWDERTEDTSQALLHSYDVVFLGGGHVPTQNRFFRELDLRKKMKGYSGMIIGISAGSMNAADVVYAQPELPGEATDPDYEKFLRGLKLTDLCILPHYQILKNAVLDGMRLFEDISMKDSLGRYFLAIPDGSFVEIQGNTQLIYGDAWMIHNERIWKICENGQTQEI